MHANENKKIKSSSLQSSIGVHKTGRELQSIRARREDMDLQTSGSESRKGHIFVSSESWIFSFHIDFLILIKRQDKMFSSLLDQRLNFRPLAFGKFTSFRAKGVRKIIYATREKGDILYFNSLVTQCTIFSLLVRAETERLDVRQLRRGAKVHRESSAHRRLQIRSQAVRVRAVLSPARHLPLQRRNRPVRHGEVFPRRPRRPLSTPDEFLPQQAGPRLLREEGTSRRWYDTFLFSYIYTHFKLYDASYWFNFNRMFATGCKWTLRRLRRYLGQSGYSDWFLWQKIACIVTLTVLSQATSIPKSPNCFEFFGFDILIDENLKPWLLEVPSASSSSSSYLDSLCLIGRAKINKIFCRPGLGCICAGEREPCLGQWLRGRLRSEETAAARFVRSTWIAGLQYRFITLYHLVGDQYDPRWRRRVRERQNVSPAEIFEKKVQDLARSN